MDFTNIKCRFCNKTVSKSKSNYNNCECRNLSYDVFSEKRKSFYMSFPEKYQIEIHFGLYNMPIAFYFKKLPHQYFSLAIISQHNSNSTLLSLDYIPGLDWQSPDLLNKLLLLTTFK